jgi:hypothetical protein
MSWLRSPMFRPLGRSPMDIRRSKRHPPLFPPGPGLKDARPTQSRKDRGAPTAPRPQATPPPGPPEEADK